MTAEAKLYFDMWVKLDRMCKDGKGESAEADDLRDQMDRPWRSLNEKQIQEVETAIRAACSD